MLLTGAHSIRDVIFFPIMKPEIAGDAQPDGENP
jgi:aspartyl-tRNA synthetase